MLLKCSKTTTVLLLVVLCVIQCEFAVSYKTEVEITPSPLDEPTTKKSGFFGGIKNFFRGSSSTTVDPLLEATTAKPKHQVPAQNPGVSVPSNTQINQKPPPLVIPKAPLMPLGPRPDTPSSSPFGGNPQQPPQWPQQHPVGGVVSTSTTLKPSHQQNAYNVQNNLPRPNVGQTSSHQQNAYNVQNNLPRPNVGQPSLPPGFAPYHPPKSQPSGLDLSYGGGAGSRPQQGGRPGFGLAPMSGPTSTSTTSTTTTAKPSQLNFDLRGDFDSKKPGSPSTGKDEYPSLPGARKPSIGGTKEDYPALPSPKAPSSSPSSPVSPSSPSAWNKPLPTPAYIAPTPTSTTVKTPTLNGPTAPKSPVGSGGSGVPFKSQTVTSTTVRPGTQGQGGNSLATDDEIRTLTETLYTKEVNNQLNLITINAQGKTRSIDSTDEAPQPLLQIDSKAFDTPTIAKMRLLFNNYEVDTMVNEHVTANERKEENDFLDAVMSTNVMRQAMLFLQSKGIVTADPKTHRDMVKELWFTQYSRGNGKIGSSGFEHVFVNEVKEGTIIGLHNWVYFYDEEKAGHLDYKGYLNQMDLGTKAKVMKVRFTHNGLNKPVNTLFIGTSPELELALYTVCFKLRPDRTCPVSLGNSKFGVVTYSWRYRGKSLIGSAYPEI